MRLNNPQGRGPYPTPIRSTSDRWNNNSPPEAQRYVSTSFMNPNSPFTSTNFDLSLPQIPSGFPINFQNVLPTSPVDGVMYDQHGNPIINNVPFGQTMDHRMMTMPGIDVQQAMYTGLNILQKQGMLAQMSNYKGQGMKQENNFPRPPKNFGVGNKRKGSGNRRNSINTEKSWRERSNSQRSNHQLHQRGFDNGIETSKQREKNPPNGLPKILPTKEQSETSSPVKDSVSDVQANIGTPKASPRHTKPKVLKASAAHNTKENQETQSSSAQSPPASIGKTKSRTGSPSKASPKPKDDLPEKTNFTKTPARDNNKSPVNQDDKPVLKAIDTNMAKATSGKAKGKKSVSKAAVLTNGSQAQTEDLKPTVVEMEKSLQAPITEFESNLAPIRIETTNNVPKPFLLSNEKENSPVSSENLNNMTTLSTTTFNVPLEPILEATSLGAAKLVTAPDVDEPVKIPDVDKPVLADNISINQPEYTAGKEEVKREPARNEQTGSLTSTASSVDPITEGIVAEASTKALVQKPKVTIQESLNPFATIKALAKKKKQAEKNQKKKEKKKGSK
jgi:hypothetical protein